MKITKHYLNKEVRLTWLDPCSDRMKLQDAKRGRAALAKWIERGIIDDVTEGVVRFVQSHAFSPGEMYPDEGIIGFVPEDLIEACEIMEPTTKKEGE